ncbi:ankyrin repeat-containing domain protein [Aspergillus pseudonomiae]|uniref:Ankyrin repeat-containing domain protein n=1 Tax=Aspergillus pseudonomiae TaxID=1506151 RepID=A0A5N7DR73_9EURO|nr:ankyrin repeat-containing domain protein [Aspergillus pseudonomiae]KAE8408914.1 ankyrin repeat-containing domain protein [Aspergillus pseudonomiae]
MDRYLVHEIRRKTRYHLHGAVSTSCPTKALLPRLLCAGAPVDQQKYNGEAAIHTAVRQNNLNSVRQLLQAGATVDVPDRHIWTPLHLASRYGYVDILRLLLKSGADVNRQGFHGWTAMHYAVREEHADCVELLLEYGADERVCDNDGRRVREGLRYGVEPLYAKV